MKRRATAPRPRLRIALDHNFPIPIVTALRDGIAEAELTPITAIDPGMRELDDADVVRAVARRGYDVLVSCDHDLFAEPAVLAIVLQTRMTVVATMGQGHDPVAASGLLLAHLPHLAAKYERDAPQVFRLRMGRRPAESPWQLLEKIAARQETTAKALFAAHRLPPAQLDRDPLAREA